MINTQITVFLGCLINDSEVLMIQRDEKECSEAHLKWELPGGKVNFNEACQETVNREFLEETGIKIKAGNEDILIKKIDRRIEIAKPECICNQGIHDGKRVDCACKLCHN